MAEAEVVIGKVCRASLQRFDGTKFCLHPDLGVCLREQVMAEFGCVPGSVASDGAKFKGTCLKEQQTGTRTTNPTKS